MANFDITRTELVWPGKYSEDGTPNDVPRVALPFQIIETINESRATREAMKDNQMWLFDIYKGNEGDTFDAGWKNKLIWGDNLLVMGSLLQKFAGKIDLIYVDPPFAIGANFSFRTEIGEASAEMVKEQSVLEEKAYRDTWGGGIATYLNMIHQRLTLMRDLLSAKGSIYVHLDATVGHYVKILMDEIFGAESFQRQIIWRIGWVSGYKSSAKNWIRNHDIILYYVKTPTKFTFNKAYVPYPNDYKRRGSQSPPGKGMPIEDVWNANKSELSLSGAESLDSIQIKSFSQEKTGYATQKNESVLRRIIRASSNEGDLVADFFCGSGTVAAAAETLNRRWIVCDLGRWAIHVTRKRLLSIETCKPFELLNLGKYERQYWQGMAFGETRDELLSERSLYEYLAFILKLYGAHPVAGFTHIHGKKGRAMIHIGAIDAPVTIAEIDKAVTECAKLGQRELHVLGWEWEMGLYDLMIEVANKKGVKMSLLQIPREVMEREAAVKGDVRFFELAYLDATIIQPKKLTTRVILKNFVISNSEMLPEIVRRSVTKWSDYIDYWAVDWNFANDTFIQGWVTYRTRMDRKLSLKSDLHIYERPGRYRILVKVIDIFGNDTSRALDVEVK